MARKGYVRQKDASCSIMLCTLTSERSNASCARSRVRSCAAPRGRKCENGAERLYVCWIAVCSSANLMPFPFRGMMPASGHNS